MKEIISEPNYTPEQLSRVKKPTLVIMGADDTVNAPDRHAQFIAGNIPNAELWVPEFIRSAARNGWRRCWIFWAETTKFVNALSGAKPPTEHYWWKI
jgi:hypothetical protein